MIDKSVNGPVSSTLCACVLRHFSHVQLFLTPCTVPCRDPLSMGFPRQEYWSGLPFPSPGDLSDSGVKPASLKSPALADRFFTTSANWDAHTPIKIMFLQKKNKRRNICG